MSIKCCKGCVALKRHPGCHGHCPEYKDEKTEHERRKAIYDQQRQIANAIYADRSKKVYKAMRDRERAHRAKGRRG